MTHEERLFTSEFLAKVTDVCLAPEVGLLMIKGSNLQNEKQVDRTVGH